jgi:predicted dehydrogenase
VTVLPVPRTPDPMDAPPLRWGILGPGWIAERFVGALHRYTRQRVVAIASRSAERSRAFATRYGLPVAHGSYEALVADAGVDVVYVATPHPAHHAHALLALGAGKHVLVEKPIGLNATEATEIADLARRSGRFCMEALWTFFLPKFDVIRQVLAEGRLGELRTVLADHGEHFTADHRIMRADLAGGPLLDLGTYPVALAVSLLGSPALVLASGQEAPSGVTGQTSVILSTITGEQAVLHTTILSDTPTTATIAGTAGTLTVDGPFFAPGGFTVRPVGGEPLTYTEPAIGHDGLHFEAAEVARRIAAGETGSPVRPLTDSVTTMHVLDEIRHQIGEVHPGESAWVSETTVVAG